MFMAVLLHAAIAGSMFLAFDFTTRKPPPMPLGNPPRQWAASPRMLRRPGLRL